MVSKLSALVGFGAGYVLGARAGRERYEQISSKARQLWQNPRVQEKASQAQRLAKTKGGAAAAVVAGKATDAGSKVAAKAKDEQPGRETTEPGVQQAAGDGVTPDVSGRPGAGFVGGTGR